VSAAALTHDDRPTVAASALAVTAAVLSVAAVANDSPQLLAIAVEVVAVLALGVGAFLYGDDRGAAGRQGSHGDTTGVADRPDSHGDVTRVAGAVLAFGVGVAGVVAAFALAIGSPAEMSQRLELAPGLLGVTVLACGLLPVRRGRWARHLVGIGAALLVISVFTSGVVYGADTVALLSATALAIVAWDAGEQAINLGTHVGRRGETATAALVHVGASTVVGVVAVTVALLVRSMQVTGLSLPALALLLGAAVLLAAALSE